jgi:myo-inositol 2-dehydrogenase / D-chiro-inositol 1-dehydrogenase
MPVHNSPASQPVPRRAFLQRAGLLTAATAVSAGLSIARSAHAAGDDALRVGLIGCGGRGTGAAVNALKADKKARLTALADLFPEKVEGGLAQLKKLHESQVAVDEAHRFAGFDAGQRLIASDVDVVLLAEPPHFRPLHLKACVEAGKHVFVEKPVAVDAPGVRSVMASCEEAKKKGLNVVSGLMYRYDPAMKEIVQRVRDGAIGEIVALQETFMMGAASGWRSGNPGATEMERQLRNWYFYTWLSGDHNVEQHVHSLDKASWVLGDVPPVAAWGMGGRQVRVESKFGNIFDHHAVAYEYANGVRVYSFCRQQPGCYNSIADQILGTKGQCNLMSHRIDGPSPWRYEGPKVNAYDLEHEALFAAIRSGTPINNGSYMAQSTLVAILGRMADYSGQRVTWEEAFNSSVSLSPARYAMDADPPILPESDGRYPIAMPGLTKAI